MSNDDQKNVWIINFCMLVSWPHFSRDPSHNTFNHRCHCDRGVPAVWASPFPKPLVIWTSPVTLTLSQIAKLMKEGDAHISRVLRMEIPKTRGCPYHCNTGSAKVFPGSGIWTKYRAGFGKPWLGTNAGLGKTTISRDDDDGGSEHSILVKRSENARDQPPPPHPPPLSFQTQQHG